MAHPTDRAGRPTAQAPTGLGEPATIPCAVCGGGQWVCENHAGRPWEGTSSRDDACNCGGAGMPCGACSLEMASAGFVDQREKAIAIWLRELEPSYSGWNDRDEVFDEGWNCAIEWVATQISTGKHWPSAQAIEARRAETLGSVEDESAAPTGCAQ